ncbi:MAG: ATP-binding protein [Muribaculaceae bacterium]
MMHLLKHITRRIAIVLMFTTLAVAICHSAEQNVQSRLESMRALERLADRNFGCPQELQYLKQLYELASTGEPDDVYRAMSISHICRYYYNAEMGDSVILWADRIDSVNLVPANYSRYFDTKYYACTVFLDRGNIEKALGRATNLQKDAKRLGSEDGEVTCYELLGDVFMKAKAYDDAIDAYSCGYKILKNQGKRSTYQFQLITMILECCIEGEKHAKYAEFLPEMERIFTSGGINPAMGALHERCQKLYMAYALNGAVTEKNFKLADQCFNQLIKQKRIDDWFVEDRTTRTLASYYEMKNEYEVALELLNKLDSSLIEYHYTLLYEKGTLLQRLSRHKEAAKNFYISLDTLRSEYTRSILSEFSQFQELCHDQYIERINKEYQAERQRNNIIYSSSALLIALVLLALFAYHVRRSSKLQYELRRSEKSLRSDESMLMQRQVALRESLANTTNNGMMKSVFLSNMSHEIRTPLNAIVGFSDMLVESAESESELSDYAGIVRQNSAQLMSLILNILDIGRLDSGRVYLCWEKVQLDEVVNTALQTYASTSSLTTSVSIEPNDLTIVTDRMRLSKVLNGVYSNAFRFTTQGSVTTRVNCVGDNVVIRIEDTGPGVPPDKAESIFERFEKIDTFTPGSGLGLSICREITSRLGGTICVDTKYTGGLAMVITLPLKSSPQA